MKLRNKKTGEIRNAVDIDMYTDSVYLKVSNGEFDNETIEYHSLAELNEEWEDYEEPKEYWCVSAYGYLAKTDVMTDLHRGAEEIGNLFDTREEAEQAVEKLKAWKRLKEKGLRFEGWDNTDRSTIHNFSLFIAIEDLESINKDLDLLFGGEE